MNVWNIIGVCSGIFSLLIGAAAFYVRVTVRAEIHEANEQQLAKIDGTYLRSAGSTLTGREIERSLTAAGWLR